MIPWHGQTHIFQDFVFALSGVCFYQWVLIDLVLIAILWKVPAIWKLPEFGKIPGLLSIPMIAAAIIWLSVPSIYWIDMVIQP